MKIVSTLRKKVGGLFFLCFLSYVTTGALAGESPIDYRSEYLIIVHESLMCPAVNDLANLRTQQGYSVYVYEVADGMTFYEIKDQIQRHYDPVYNSYQLLNILLIGNASMDTLNWDIVNSQANNFIPSFWEWVDMEGHSTRMIAYDEVYSYLDDDESIRLRHPYMPDLYTGRIPAESIDQASVFINKLIDYESNNSHEEWKDNVLLIAGDLRRGNPPADGDVRLKSQELVEIFVPADWESKILYYSLSPDSIIDGDNYIIDNRPNRVGSLSFYLNRGQLIMSALGTGANQRKFCYYVERDYFDAGINLNNYLKYPVVYAASCDLGRFDDYNYIGQDSHFENFLFAENAGAIAWIAPTWGTGQRSDFFLSQFFYDSFFNRKVANLGRLNYLAKLHTYVYGQYNGRDVRQFNLYGDPGMRISVNPGFEPAFRYTGFELSDVRVLQNTVFDSANCSNICARIIPEKFVVESPFHNGLLDSKRVYKLKGEDISYSRDSKAYWKLIEENISIDASIRFLTFWMYVQESPAGLGNLQLGHICLDGVLLPGSILHDYPIFDQYGQRIGPANHTPFRASGNTMPLTSNRFMVGHWRRYWLATMMETPSRRENSRRILTKSNSLPTGDRLPESATITVQIL